METVRLSAEDEAAIKVTGVSRSDFIASRQAEQDRKAARSKPAVTPTATPKPAARADMGAPCVNCGHSSAHSCSAASCSCNGTMPKETPTDAITPAEIAICARLGVRQSEYLKIRREEAGRT